MKQMIGHYIIDSELGRGGMGVVYKGHDPSLERDVAIKLLSEQFAADDNLLERFIREAKSAAALNHPHITQVYFIGQQDGRHYFVMEFVDGESLSGMIRRERHIPPKRAAKILLQAAQGLAAAHDKGIIHRDIKPANIMLTKQGNVKVTDFGIAHYDQAQNKLTATGQLLGTPGYFSPEACLGEATDHRADIFSLGIVYYEMLVGKIPFDGDSPYAKIHQVVQAEIPDVRQLNEAVDTAAYLILTKMIEKQPDKRYADCHQLITDLENYLGDRPLVFAGMGHGTPPMDETVVTSHVGPNTRADAVPPPPPAFKSTGAPPPTPPTIKRSDVPPPLDNDPTVVNTSPPKPPEPPHISPVTPPPAKKRSGMVPLLAFLTIVAVLAVAAFFLWPKGEDSSFSSGDDGTSVTEKTGNGDGGINVSPAGDETPKDPDTDFSTQGTGQAQVGSDSTSEETEPAETDINNQALADNGNTNNSDEGQSQSALQQSPGGSNSQSGRTGTIKNPDTADSDPQIAVKDESPTLVKQGEHQVRLDKTNVLDTTTVQKVQPEQTKAAMPARPNITVVSGGDPLFASAFSGFLNDLLAEENDFSLLDTDMIEGLEEGAANLHPSNLTRLVHVAGGHFLIHSETEIIGERELQYMGRSNTAYRAVLTVKCYRLHDSKLMGKTIKRELEYTSLSARREAETAANDMVNTLLNDMREGRR